MMPSARQLTHTSLVAVLLMALSVSASETMNKINVKQATKNGIKLSSSDLSTSASLNNNQMVSMRGFLPQQLQTSPSNIYQSQPYLSSSSNVPRRQPLPHQGSMQTSANYNQAGDLNTAAGHYHKHHHHKPHGKYYEYREVPHKKAWKFGYKRGNHKHTIERHEHGKGPHFKTKVKWHDKKGKGVHLWDYNHYDKKKKHYG